MKRKKKQRSKSSSEFKRQTRKRKRSIPDLKSVSSYPKNEQSTSSSHTPPTKGHQMVNIGQDLFSLNSHQKNPVIYPSTLKKFVKGRKVTLSPMQMAQVGRAFNGTGRKVVSFDQRMKGDGSRKSSKGESKSISGFDFEGIIDSSHARQTARGILRWDDFTFSNKQLNFKEEKKRIKKKVKNFKAKSCFDEHEGKTPKNKKCGSSTRRKDMFGNTIHKGGVEHRVSFSFHGDMKIIENWKKFNKLNSYKPDYSQRRHKLGEKKKCGIF